MDHRFNKHMAPCQIYHHSVWFPKQCGNTWGSYGSSKKPGCLDRGAGEVLNGIHRYFRGFVLACSFVCDFRSFRVAATDGSGFCL